MNNEKFSAKTEDTALSCEKCGLRMQNINDIRKSFCANLNKESSNISRYKNAFLASDFNPQVLAIGASAGGPQCLIELLSELKNEIDLPVFIVQHLPYGFSESFAELITTKTGRECTEASNNERIVKNKIYLAPGDFHMSVYQSEADYLIKVDRANPVNFCRPSVDILFHSLSQTYGQNVLAVVLTGNGQDGTEGAKYLKNEGAKIIVQDEESSMIWGMPGSVVEAGHASAILPLSEISLAIQMIITKSDLTGEN